MLSLITAADDYAAAAVINNCVYLWRSTQQGIIV